MQCLNLEGGQTPPAAGLQTPQLQGTDRRADELGNRMPDRVAHPPDLPVAALVDRYLDQGPARALVDDPGTGRCSDAVVELDAGA
jgi:hypothetical protein